VQDRTVHGWQVAASAVATAATTFAAASTQGLGLLRVSNDRLDPPSWLSALVSLPDAAWWGAMTLLAVLLFLVGLRLSRRWGVAALFLAPVAMLGVRYAAPWLLYAPMRAGLPSLTFGR